MPDNCERCKDEPRAAGLRFCNSCKKIVLDELRASGTLAPNQYHGSSRTDDHKENTRETKRGREG